MWVFVLVWQFYRRIPKPWTPCSWRKIHTGSLEDVFPVYGPSRFEICVVHFKAASPTSSYCFIQFWRLTFSLTLPTALPSPIHPPLSNTNLSVCPASLKDQKVAGVRPVGTIARRLQCWTYKMEDTTGRRRGCTAPAPARVSFCFLRRWASGNRHPRRTLVRLRGGEVAGGWAAGRRKVEEHFFFFLSPRAFRGSRSPPRASWWGWAGGGGAAQQQRKPDLGDKRLHSDMQQSFHCSWMSCGAHNAPVTGNWQVQF